MILESPLTAYFHTDFCHISPLGPQLSLDLRAETKLAFASMEGPLIGHKMALVETRLQTFQIFGQMSFKHFEKGGNIFQQMDFCAPGSSEFLFTVV